MTKTFCPYAWMHLSAATDGNIRLCCNVTTVASSIKDEYGADIHIGDIKNIQDTFNTSAYKDIRKKMLAGEPVEFCQRCYDTENNGGKSIRNFAVNQYGIEEYTQNTDITGYVKGIKIKSLDLSWSNLCNLKCKMCHPDATNQLIEEYINFGESYKEIDLNKWTFDALYNTLETVSPSIEEILVTGGEPLLNKDFLKYIDYLVEKDYAKNIKLVFHTNLTIMPSKFLERFGKFKHTQIHISIDGVDETYEYIRYPGKWKVIEKNINKLVDYIKNSNNIGAEAHVVFQSYNMHNICDLIKYFNQFKDIKNFEPFPYFISLYDPWHSHISNVPLRFRNQYATDINQLIKDLNIDTTTHFYGSLKSCLAMIDDIENSPKRFLNHVTSRDEYRNQNAVNVLPWLNC